MKRRPRITIEFFTFDPPILSAFCRSHKPTWAVAPAGPIDDVLTWVKRHIAEDLDRHEQDVVASERVRKPRGGGK